MIATRGPFVRGFALSNKEVVQGEAFDERRDRLNAQAAIRCTATRFDANPVFARSIWMSDAPTTSDGRYLIVRGRLWRKANPGLSPERHAALVGDLMAARLAVGAALRAGDEGAEHAARAKVDAAKHALGERGPVWWADGAPDLNRHMAANTPYAAWADTLA